MKKAKEIKNVNDKRKKKVPLTLESIQQLITRHKEVEEGKRLASVGARLGKQVLKRMKSNIKKGKNEQQASNKPKLAPTEIKKEENKQQVSTSTVIPELALSVNPKLDPKDDFRGKIITAKWVWFNGSFQQNVLLKIDKDGKIEDIFKEDHELFTIEEGKIVDLGEMALLPGFVNAHSHAFHRELRGLSQIGNEGADNFWKWRQNMYKLVEDIDYEKLKKICIDTFSEMLSAGITTVGEFHYVHHSNKADGFFDFDMAVIEAACEVGIRLVLIETLYMRAGFSQPDINPEQWRFSCATVEQFIEHVEDLREKLKTNDLVTLALAVHSFRAVPIPEATKLYQYARQNDLPLHLHLEELPAELDDCRLVNGGKDPAEILLQNILENGETEEIDSSLITAVHCTHTKRLNLDEFVKRKNKCYLGDGIPHLNEFDNICLGTDCNNRIAMFEEMRWLAFCQNMRTNTRNCGYLHAEKLFECATINGAKSLGLISKIGDFVIGKQMDFFGILLKNFKLKNFCDDKKLLDSLIFGGGNEEIGTTGIGGIVKFNK
uniref:Amidohydrolase-related domain-containing protein n=1 Tax=Meloidogyne enterolobii TaxID=390850 RepID=A0A6V7UIV6_MELEN|nr:unnamed protein product [Meloidogyne enterolobii]